MQLPSLTTSCSRDRAKQLTTQFVVFYATFVEDNNCNAHLLSEWTNILLFGHKNVIFADYPIIRKGKSIVQRGHSCAKELGVAKRTVQCDNFEDDLD